MSSSSEIGRYGTLRLLKRHAPETTVAFFPVDDEVVTFGRGKRCSIRLYYDCVSELHCTLQISEDHKAFLLVHGTNGILVDGCQVFPAHSPGGSGANTSTVPLTNGSEIEIYKKRFRFEYPPKEIRAALLATPRNARARRSLRMSMIESAQVFTPRGNASIATPHTPHGGELGRGGDWKALRSPVKIPSRDGTLEEETTLLEGAEENAFIVEEEKDIIVLETVDSDTQEEEQPSPTEGKLNRGRYVAFSTPVATPALRPISVPQSVGALQRIPQAPPAYRRRSLPSLHRAVVLRSAQRALQREQERFEEQQEEDEVEAEVSPERELGPIGDGDGYDTISELQPPLVQSVTRPARRVSAFRASLDAMRNIIPLPFNWKVPEDVPLPDDDDDVYEESHEQDNRNQNKEDDSNDADNFDDEEEYAIQTPVRRNLGPFMTPQIRLNRSTQQIPIDGKTRASIGGEGAAHGAFGGAQRVRVIPVWKVTDIVLPDPEKPPVKEKQEPKREPISEEERQEIMVRRKSALQTPASLPMPGPRIPAFPPPVGYVPGEDADEDAETMVEKMQQKIADVRRKREVRKASMSIASGGRHQGGEFSLLASSTEHTRRDVLKTSIVEGRGGQRNDVEASTRGVIQTIPDTADLNSHDEIHDELDLLETSNGTNATSGARPSSLTPRFDGIREMFRQPREEPKTPSFTGIRTMFKERSETNPQTPSFRGVKELFNLNGVVTGVATPRFDLGQIFDEDEGELSHDPEDESEALTSGAKAGTRIQKAAPAAASASKRSLRKKDVAAVGVPSAVLEEEDGNDDKEEIGHVPRSPVRRGAKRSTRNADTPTTGDILPPSDKSNGRTGLRNTRQTGSENTKKGVVVHRTSKRTKFVEDHSREEEQSKSVGNAHRSGKGKGKVRQTISENKMELDEQEISVKAGDKLCQTSGAETSDGEGIVPSKPRRVVRAAKKTPQGGVTPIGSMPVAASTRPTRRTFAETSLDVDEPALAPKLPKSRRGGKTKAAESIDGSPGEREDDHSYEAEIATPAPTKRIRSKKDKRTKKPVVPDDTFVMSDDEKENSGQRLPKSSDKTGAPIAVRARGEVGFTPVEGFDAPAKRTRSRK